MADESKDQAQDQAETKDNQQEQEQQEQKGPANKVTIEDLEQSRKKITIEIDRAKIDGKFNEIFGELHKTALVPGFRIGHAPRRLLEKRYGKDAAQDVRNSLVAEALGDVDKQEELDILGEPDIKLDDIELPEKGNLTFSVEVEVKPKFDVPEYKGIPVAEPALPAAAEHAAEVTRRILSQRGTMVPVEDEVKIADQIIADVKVKGEGIDHKVDNAELRVAPGAVAGIPIEDLGEKLAGAKRGQSVEIKTKVPAGHKEESWRDKDVSISFELKEVKRLELPPLTDELAKDFGFDNADAMRSYVGQRAEAQITQERNRLRRQVVSDYLLDNTKMDLPEAFTRRQAVRVLRRQYIDLLQRGVPREQIDQNLEFLEAQAGQTAQRELKLSFILEKIAKAEDISVAEGEVNAWIAQIASQQGRRPERLRQEMDASGTLGEVEVELREQKTLDKLLEMAESKPAEEKPAKAAAEKAEKPAKKEHAKKEPAAKKESQKEASEEESSSDEKKPAAKGKPRGGKKGEGKKSEE